MSAWSGEAIATLWGAGATLATGIAAVAGAVIVGLKQVGISSRQTRILERQVELERAKLALELYEKRYRAYDASAALLSEAMSGMTARPTEQISVTFIAAMTEARFLFPESVVNSMKEMWEKVQQYYALRRKMASDHDRTGAYAQGDPDASLAIEAWLDDRIRTLHEAFPQLSLSEADKRVKYSIVSDTDARRVASHDAS